MSRPQTALTILSTMLLLLTLLVPSGEVLGAPRTPQDTARQILQQADVSGGLIVHLGCGSGQLTAALRQSDRYLVHGLEVDAKQVEAARRRLVDLKLAGPVSVDRFNGHRLPYVDNLVNLVVAERLGTVPMAELMRVICPGGTLCVKQDGRWTYKVKPRSDRIDEWTHFLHGPDNNAVAHDSCVDLPRRLQWLGAPRFARAHEQLASVSACVTTGGRMFYIVDEAPCADVRFPSQWVLIARDAFNGVVLWKRPIPAWVDQLRRFRSGPAETAFRLVAQDDRVYVTLGIDAPVSILDAVTGRTVAVCRGTENARQILRLDEKLLVLVDTAPQRAEAADSQVRRGEAPSPGKRAIVAVDAADGRLLWQKDIKAFVHPTLAACDGRLYYQTNAAVYCADIDNGDELWHADNQLSLSGHEAGWESPTLVAETDRVYSADFKRIVAYDARDGAVLWNGASGSGYNSPPDVFLIDDLLWVQRKGMTALDPATGEVKKSLGTQRGYMHPRCYRNKATDRFAILGLQGVQFVDLESADVSPNHWVRGTCQYGVMPANGLLYVTPDSCACNMKSKLSGLWTLAPEDKAESGERKAEGDVRLERGPAFGALPSPQSPAPSSHDWPVYRHDFRRSGTTDAQLPTELVEAWNVGIGGRLSGITAAAKRVFVAAVDAHTVYALDETSGETLWSFTAGGRVDCPPTIYQGLTLFGSADGFVYALRAADGQLVWRRRAAPEDRRTFVRGQLESVWPVHGSILVHEGEIVLTAGRSSYLDGGIRLLRLEPKSGRLISEATIYSPDPATGNQPQEGDRKDVRGLLSDILLADGDDVYMRHVKLDLTSGAHEAKGVHMYSPIGLLEDSWWHRGYWVFSDQFTSHWSGWWRMGNQVPSGRILSYDDRSIYGYGRNKYVSGNTGQWRGGERYRLFACDRDAVAPKPKPPAVPRQPGKKKGKRPRKPAPAPKPVRWEAQTPMYVRAMVVAGPTIVIAGPPEMARPQGVGEQALVLANPEDAVAAWQGRRGGRLSVVSTADGRELSQLSLESPPVFDGMAATEGRLYLSTVDGRVVCFEGK